MKTARVIPFEPIVALPSPSIDSDQRFATSLAFRWFSFSNAALFLCLSARVSLWGVVSGTESAIPACSERVSLSGTCSAEVEAC